MDKQHARAHSYQHKNSLNKVHVKRQNTQHTAKIPNLLASLHKLEYLRPQSQASDYKSLVNRSPS